MAASRRYRTRRIRGIPQIKASTTVDATSQPGAGQVELSGGFNPNLGAGAGGLQLVSGSAGSVIKGMVINGYPRQISLFGGEATIEDDRLDTNPAGTQAVTNPLGASQGLGHTSQIGVDLASSGNQIGGPTPVRAMSSPTGWYIPSNLPPPAAIVDNQAAQGAAANSNKIEGNRIGVDAGRDGALGRR